MRGLCLVLGLAFLSGSLSGCTPDTSGNQSTKSPEEIKQQAAQMPPPPGVKPGAKRK